MLRKILRELVILRKLSEMKDNIYTTRIIDIILPASSMKKSKFESDFLPIKEETRSMETADESPEIVKTEINKVKLSQLSSSN